MILERRKTQSHESCSVLVLPEGEPKSSCPDPEQIVLYTLGDLDENERVTLESHFRSCEKCRAEVWALSDAIEDAMLEG